MSVQIVQKTISLPHRHQAQQTIVDEAQRFNVLNCGRRFGKDVLGMDLLIDTSISGFPTAWASPSYKNMTDVWRVLQDILQPVTQRKSEHEHRLELYGGGIVDLWSLDRPNIIRGRAYKRFIINEAAIVPELAYAWEEVIRPTLTDYKGDAWFLSTPKGFNYFKTLYDRGQDPEQPDWMSWTFPTVSNPYIDPAEIEEARLLLPEKVFEQEYLAVFLSDATSVFRGLSEAAVLNPCDPQPGHHYVVGADWGKIADMSVFSVIDASEKKQVFLDRSNKIDYTLQIGRLKALCDRYKPLLIVSETNAMGQAIIEWVQRAKLPVWGWNTTMASKQKMIDDLVLAFENRTLKILRDPVQLSELRAFTAGRTPGGLLKYSAPVGQHDDTVIALALAWQAAQAPKPGKITWRKVRWESK